MKKDLVVVGPEGPRPFMRGILVQSLVSRGVPFEVALKVANTVRQRVAEIGRVRSEELWTLVDEVLGEGYDLEVRARLAVEPPPLVVSPGGSTAPFSKGLLAVSLQTAGLDPSEAHDVARELEERLLREGRREFERSLIRTLASETLERTHGERAAERYRIWRAAINEERPIFVLLGGSSGVGKTSIAVEVARRLEISRVIGTDAIRQIMRLMFSEDLMPEIHSSTYEAHRLVDPEGGGGSAAVIAGYREQAQKIAVGVHALLDRALEENTSMLIEGVNLLPGLIDLDRYRDALVVFLVVGTLDRDAYRNRFTSRAMTARERPADRYLRHIDEILAIQDYILAEADHFDIPIIENVQFDDVVSSVIRSVIAVLKKSMVPPVDRSSS